MNQRKSLLVVDDVDIELVILTNLLSDDYEIMTAMNGVEALEVAVSKQPDLVLLDIMMPGMDGYEVCRRLKEAPETMGIPIIFVTADSADEQEAKGLQYGAVDYITKPYSPAVVQERVKTHLLLAEQREQLEQSISLLEHEKDLLQQKAELGLQAGCLAHDMANIFAGLASMKYLPREFPENDEDWQDVVEALDEAEENVRLGMDVCKGYTSYLRGLGEPACKTELPELLGSLDMFLRQFKGELVRDVEEDLPPVDCKGWQIKRVLANLFSNAMHAVEGSEAPRIELRLWSEDNSVKIMIRDNGCGIAPDRLPKIFEESYSTKANGTGLGLYIAQQIMDAHGGSIELESEPGQGAEFVLSLPIER